MSQKLKDCPEKDCDFVNVSGGEADLNFHLSSHHKEAWKEKQKKINKQASEDAKKKHGKDYVRKLRNDVKLRK